jgi:hypothetical protein
MSQSSSVRNSFYFYDTHGYQVQPPIRKLVEIPAAIKKSAAKLFHVYVISVEGSNSQQFKIYAHPGNLTGAGKSQDMDKSALLEYITPFLSGKSSKLKYVSEANNSVSLSLRNVVQCFADVVSAQAVLKNGGDYQTAFEAVMGFCTKDLSVDAKMNGKALEAATKHLNNSGLYGEVLSKNQVLAILHNDISLARSGKGGEVSEAYKFLTSNGENGYGMSTAEIQNVLKMFFINTDRTDKNGATIQMLRTFKDNNWQNAGKNGSKASPYSYANGEVGVVLERTGEKKTKAVQQRGLVAVAPAGGGGGGRVVDPAEKERREKNRQLRIAELAQATGMAVSFLNKSGINDIKIQYESFFKKSYEDGTTPLTA